MSVCVRKGNHQSLRGVGALFAGALAVLWTLPGSLEAGQSQFYTKLVNGESPFFMVVGNSTSQNASTTTWSSYPKTYCEWPLRLKEELESLGDLRFEGHTAPGKHSGNFIEGTDGFSHGLEWVKLNTPDALIMEFAPGADAVGRFNITVAQSKANHETIIDELLAAKPDMEIFLWTGARSTGGKWEDRSSRVASDEGQPEYAQMLIELAEEKGPQVLSVDTYTEMFAIYENQGSSVYGTYMHDENHTNNKAATEIIVPEIMKVMREGNGPPPALTLVSPTPNSDYNVGDVMTISWNYNPDSVDAPIEISYSTDGGMNWLAITSSVGIADQSYDWTIPQQLAGVDVVSQEGMIKISDYDAYEYTGLASVMIKPFGSEPIVIDNTDSHKIEYVGAWTTSSSTSGSAFVGTNYMHDGNEGKGSKEAIFSPGLVQEGDYLVSMQWSAFNNRASNVPVVIKTMWGDQTVTVNQVDNGGQWNDLGTFALGTDATITVKNEGTDGYVIVDGLKVEYLGPASSAIKPAAMMRTGALKRSRIVTTSSMLRVPAGVAGVRLYSVNGRLLYKADRLGDINQERVVTSPIAGCGISTFVVDYVE
jgi:hypothetical protein